MNNQELKNKILTEFYQTGRIHNLYFGIESKKSNLNPVKAYISNCLFKTRLFGSSIGVQDNDFISDIYNEAFLHLSNMDVDKFCDLYNSGKIKGSSLIAVTLRIIVLKCFSIDKRSLNPKHSLVSWLGYGSSFNTNNFLIPPVEINDNENSNSSNISLYDDETELSSFEVDYGFSIENLIENLRPEARYTFYKLLDEKNKPGAPSNARKEEKKKLADEILNVKKTLEQKKGISND